MVEAVTPENIIAQALNGLHLAPAPGLRIVPHASRSYAGRRARRMAFYRRQRLGRLLFRLTRHMMEKERAKLERATREAVVYGTGWFTVGPDTLVEREISPTPDPEVFSVIDTMRNVPGSRYTPPT